MRRQLICLLLISCLAPATWAAAQVTTPAEKSAAEPPNRVYNRWKQRPIDLRLPLNEGFLAFGTTRGDGQLDSYNTGEAGFVGARLGGHFSATNGFISSWLGTFDHSSKFRLADYIRLELQMGQRSFDRAEGGPIGSTAGKASGSWTTWRLGLGFQGTLLLNPDLEVGAVTAHFRDSKSFWNETHQGISGRLFGTRVRYNRFAAELQVVREIFGAPGSAPMDHHRTLRLRYYKPSGYFFGIDLERESMHPEDKGWLVPKSDSERLAKGIRLLVGKSS